MEVYTERDGDMKYLYVTDWESLRKEKASVRKRHFARLAAECERYEKQKLPQEHPLASITYYGMAAANLAFMYKLTGQKRYLWEARRWIFAGVEYPHWGRAVKVDVDLSAAWLLFGYGLAYNWIGEDLSAQDRQKLLEKLILQGERMYQHVKEGKDWVYEYWQNHNWIDYTGLAVAGYAIRDTYAPAGEWIQRCRENFERVYALLPEDGSDYEGVVYWRYGVIWLFLYAELCRQQEGIDWFQTSDFLRNTFFYRLYMLGPDRVQNFNFGDCHDRLSGHIPCLYYKVASEYRNGYAMTLAEEVLTEHLYQEGYESGVKPGILPEAFLEYLWYDPTVEAKPLEELPVWRYFADLGLFSHRTSWDKESVAFACKCAPGGGWKQWRIGHGDEEPKGVLALGHHHPDAGSFLMIRGRDYLVVDEGYSGDKKTKHHNVVLVDGQGYCGDGGYDAHRRLGKDQTPEVLAMETCEKGFYFCADTAKLYAPELGMRQVRREIFSTHKGWILIADTISSTRPHTYTWLLHSDTQPAKVGEYYRIENAASWLRIYPGEQELRYGILLMRNEANVTSQEPDNIVYTRLYTLCQENKLPATQMTFINVLIPGGEESEEVPIWIEHIQNGYTVRIGEERVQWSPERTIIMTQAGRWETKAPKIDAKETEQ